LTGSQQIAGLTGGDSSGSNTLDGSNGGNHEYIESNGGNGIIDSAEAGSILTIAATSSIPSSSNTFAGNFWQDVGLTLDNSLNNVSQTLTLTGTVNPTTGNFKVGNSHNSSATATSTLIVNGILGDNGANGGPGTMTVGPNGILAGHGVINNSTTVQAGGIIRGGVPGGGVVSTNNYGTLTLGSATTSPNLTLLGGSTLQIEVNRSSSPITTNNFYLGSTNAGTLAGDASLINVANGNILLGGSIGSAKLGTATGKYVTVNLLDTVGSLVPGENYTFQLAYFGNEVILGNTMEGAGALIDTGTGVGLGKNGYFNVSVTNNSAYANSIMGWSVSIDSSDYYLLLTTSSAASVPEPAHIMLLCAGMLMAGLGAVSIRRLWRRQPAGY
jgi:hypothetical protein